MMDLGHFLFLGLLLAFTVRLALAVGHIRPS
jgi:hypothetical protein